MSTPEFTLPACLVKYLPPDVGEDLRDAIATAVEDYVREKCRDAMRATTELILCANFGPVMGRALFLDIIGDAAACNRELVDGVLTRAAVSKASVRIRRGLGLPIRSPRNARPKKSEETVAKWRKARGQNLQPRANTRGAQMRGRVDENTKTSGQASATPPPSADLA
jgi:hypothetical protein